MHKEKVIPSLERFFYYLILFSQEFYFCLSLSFFQFHKLASWQYSYAFRGLSEFTQTLIIYHTHTHSETDKDTHPHTDRQRKTDTKTYRYNDKQTHRHTDIRKHTDKHITYKNILLQQLAKQWFQIKFQQVNNLTL